MVAPLCFYFHEQKKIQQLGSLELLELESLKKLKQFPTFITLGYIMVWITESCRVLLLLSITFSQ